MTSIFLLFLAWPWQFKLTGPHRVLSPFALPRGTERASLWPWPSVPWIHTGWDTSSRTEHTHPPFSLPGYYCVCTDFCLKGQLRTEDWPGLGECVLTYPNVCSMDFHELNTPVEPVPRWRPRLFPVSPLPLQALYPKGNHHPASFWQESFIFMTVIIYVIVSKRK